MALLAARGFFVTADDSERPLSLHLAPCSHAEAKHAVENWHYSRVLPVPPLLRIGVWEDGEFIGVVLFGRPTARRAGQCHGLEQREMAELKRVALTAHRTAVSRIVAIAVRLLRQHWPEVRLILSYADPAKGHRGGIYQAGGWTYAGRSTPTVEYLAPDGRRWHSRMVSPTGRKKVYGQYRPVVRPSDCEAIRLPGKFKYLMPLTAEQRAAVAPLAKPYPRANEVLIAAQRLQPQAAAQVRPVRFDGNDTVRTDPP